MEWITSLKESILSSNPHVLAVRAMVLLSSVGALQLSAGELTGNSLAYSKFARDTPSDQQGTTHHNNNKTTMMSKGDGRSSSTSSCSSKAITVIPSRPAMLIAYTPALFLCFSFLLLQLIPPSTTMSSARILPHSLARFFLQPHPTDSRLLVFAAATTLHFLKRDLEVLFLHKYSGTMELKVSLFISISYFCASAMAIYALQVSINSSEAYSTSLMACGILMFLLGMGGNFYHHYLLACLRPKNSSSTSNTKKQYVTPQGGLFSLVVCPHYLFEFIDFLGLAMIAQTMLSFIFAFQVFITLGLRSRSTKLWYLKKIDDFPKDRKCFLPYIF